MSGGSLDYFFSKVEDIAEEIESRADTPLQKAFVSHLKDVANALYDLEWVYSGDKGTGDEEDSIKKVLGKDYKSKAFDILKKECESLITELNKFL